MRKPRAALIAAAIAASFVALAATIIVMSAAGVITQTVAKLMLVALLGLYFGFGFLIAVYQLLRKLD
jgi:uncharacterized membrane protein YccC